MKRILLVVLVLFLSACSKNTEQESFFITNILDNSSITYSSGGVGNNVLPFMIMTDTPIVNLEVVLENEGNYYNMDVELVTVDKQDLELSLPYLFSKYDYDIEKIVELQKMLDGEFDFELSAKISEELADLTKISKKREEKVQKLFEKANIYMVASYFSFDTIHYPSTYNKLTLKDQGKTIYEKEIQIKFDDDNNSEKISQMIGAAMNMEVQLSDKIRFDYPMVFKANSESQITSYSIDNEDLEIDTLYIRHKKNDKVDIIELKGKQISELNLSVKENDIVTFVPTINVVNQKSPFFFGSFKASIGIENEKFDFDSGLLTSQLDPYIYYGYFIENLKSFEYLNYLLENEYMDRREIYIDLEKGD